MSEQQPQPQRDPDQEALENALRELDAETRQQEQTGQTVQGAFQPVTQKRERVYNMVERRVRATGRVPDYPLDGIDAQYQWEERVGELVHRVLLQQAESGFRIDPEDVLDHMVARAKLRAQEEARRLADEAAEAERKAKLDRQLALVGIPFGLGAESVRSTYGDDPEIARAYLLQQQKQAREQKLEDERQDRAQAELQRAGEAQARINHARDMRQLHEENYREVMYRVWPFIRFGGMLIAGIGVGSSVTKHHGPLLGGLAGVGAALGWQIGCTWLEGSILTTPEVGTAALRGGVQAVLPQPLGGMAAAGIAAAEKAAPPPVPASVIVNQFPPPFQALPEARECGVCQHPSAHQPWCPRVGEPR